MVLDTTSLRIAFACMTLALVLLFCFCTYRPTRAPYSGWWCLALLLYLAGSACFLLNKTVHQIWANPLGNVLLVSGGLTVWAAARSLRAGNPPMPVTLGVPLLTLIASATDNPATNTWSGGPVFLAAMALTFALTSGELWRLEKGYSDHQTSMAVTSGALAVFYSLRLLAFVLDGQDGPTFVTVFGPAATTIVTMVLLVVVSFSMAALSSEQQLCSLYHSAARDHLTGLVNRKGLLDAVAEHQTEQAASPATGALIMADLDHFKFVNDTYGHAAGDKILQSFARACTNAVAPTDIVGRYGGEEFLILMPGATAEQAEALTKRINLNLEVTATEGGANPPTVSYGIAIYYGSISFPNLIAEADRALYQAKAQGRNRAVHSDQGLPRIR